MRFIPQLIVSLAGIYAIVGFVPTLLLLQDRVSTGVLGSIDIMVHNILLSLLSSATFLSSKITSVSSLYLRLLQVGMPTRHPNQMHRKQLLCFRPAFLTPSSLKGGTPDLALRIFTSFN